MLGLIVCVNNDLYTDIILNMLSLFFYHNENIVDSIIITLSGAYNQNFDI